MTLGERLIELANYGFDIRFSKRDAVSGYESLIIMKVSRGHHNIWFALDPYEFRHISSLSMADECLLEELNRCAQKIIDAEKEGIPEMARGKNNGSDKQTGSD